MVVEPIGVVNRSNQYATAVTGSVHSRCEKSLAFSGTATGGRAVGLGQPDSGGLVWWMAVDGLHSRTYHQNMEYSKDRVGSVGHLATTRALIISTRPKQWTKNLIIYFALFFTIDEAWRLGDAGDITSFLGKTTAAFVLFSAISGAVYLVNDISDVEEDRRHPKKRYRPIASGQLPIPLAWTTATVLIITALSLSFALEPAFGVVCSIYLGTMGAYTLLLKRLLLLDVFSISAGFVLRAVAGAAVIAVPISPWLYTCTGLGALFIALTKRRSELSQAGEHAGQQRDTLEQYTATLLNQLIAVVATATLIAYILYAFTADNLPDNHAMMFTIPFVVYGLFRYMFLVHSRRLGENPEDILITDIPLIASIILWLTTAFSILVVFR